MCRSAIQISLLECHSAEAKEWAGTVINLGFSGNLSLKIIFPAFILHDVFLLISCFPCVLFKSHTKVVKILTEMTRLSLHLKRVTVFTVIDLQLLMDEVFQLAPALYDTYSQ